MTMSSYGEMDEMAREYRKAVALLIAERARHDREIETIRRKYAPAMDARMRDVATGYSLLHDAVEDTPELFGSPRTRLTDGIKYGYRKGRGAMVIENADKTVERILGLLPERADELTRTSIVPDKAGLEKLDAKTLKKLGVHIEEAVDEIVVEVVEPDSRKLLKEALKRTEVAA